MLYEKLKDNFVKLELAVLGFLFFTTAALSKFFDIQEILAIYILGFSILYILYYTIIKTNIFNVLIYVIVFFLPFTDTLVFNVGFPLKIYEIAGVFLIAVVFSEFLTKRKFILDYRNNTIWKILIFIYIYFLCGIFSFYNLSNFVSFPSWADGRHAPYICFITKFLYLILNFFILIALYTYLKSLKKLKKIVKILLVTSSIVSLYGIYLAICSFLGIEYFHLPGTLHSKEITIGTLFNVRRNSTFSEGNFFAGFLICITPFSISQFYISKTNRVFSKPIILLILIIQILGLFSSFSTLGYLSLVIILGLFFFKKRKIVLSKSLIKKIAFIIFVFLFLFYFFSNDVVQSIIVSKFFSYYGSYQSYSLYDRLNQTLTALNIFVHYPIFGVGPTNYGFYFHQYSVDKKFSQGQMKHISNNIYAELLAETGIIGFTAFLILVFSIYLNLRRAYFKIRYNYRDIDNKMLILGAYISFFIIAFTFFAFPTFTMTIHWVMFAIFISIPKIIKREYSKFTKNYVN